MIKSRLKANAVARPASPRERRYLFGVIDLMSMKAIVYRDETLGADYEVDGHSGGVPSMRPNFIGKRWWKSICENDDSAAREVPWTANRSPVES